ncbi:MAG: polysaccharide deacetylase family protein, partial [Tistlia sp.]
MIPCALAQRHRRLSAPLRLERPALVVVVDTEEEFDWHKPFDRGETSVSAIDEIGRFQRIFEAYGVRPVYAIDYPVADSDHAVEVLGRLVEDGRAEIGAQLHTWVNPPFAEAIDNFNSYQGNLPAALEAEKLERLAGRIRERFGHPALIHKAGRYGFGANTLEILQRLGFLVDMSATPAFDFSPDGGPNYLRFEDRIGWLGQPGGVLELPNSGGFVGGLARWGARMFELSGRPAGRMARAAGLMARLRLVERIRLSPEGHRFEDMKRFTLRRLGQGQQCFVVSLHSPSSMVGGTPYSATVAERDALVSRLERYLAFFMGELNGQP